MTYHATTQRSLLLFFLLLGIGGILANIDNPHLFYVLIPYIIYCFVTILMQFEFEIVDGSLTFKIRVLNLTLYNKEVHHNQIVSMKFKRVGWAKKYVIVRNKQGLNFRIANFSPENIYNDLVNFANEYEIPITKTKDYLILEKLG